LQSVPATFGAQVSDILLMAFVRAINAWTGERSLLLNLERHGREELFEDVDLSRTMGWLTTIFPVEFSLSETDTSFEALSAIREQLQRIPNKGLGYGVLRYLTEDEEMKAHLLNLPQAEVNFNYLGQFEQGQQGASLLKLSGDDTGDPITRRGLRSHLLEVNGYIARERLALNWSYSGNLHRRATIERVAQRFLEEIRLFILAAELPEELEVETYA
jgi:non-ribosomal peptide synthase protein (TIGR01720 family)